MFSGKAYPNWGLLAGDWGAPKMRKTNRKKIPPPPPPVFSTFIFYLAHHSWYIFPRSVRVSFIGISSIFISFY